MKEQQKEYRQKYYEEYKVPLKENFKMDYQNIIKRKQMITD